MNGRTQATQTRRIHTSLPALCFVSGYYKCGWSEKWGGELVEWGTFWKSTCLPSKAAPMQLKDKSQLWGCYTSWSPGWTGREAWDTLYYVLAAKRFFLHSHDLCFMRQRWCVVPSFRTMHCHHFLCLSRKSSMSDL